MRYDVTVPSGLSQVMRMEVESMSEKVRSFGRSIAVGKGGSLRQRFDRTVSTVRATKLHQKSDI